MKSRHFAILASLALGGCGAGAWQTAADANYVCYKADRPDSDARYISIHPAADHRSLALTVNRQPSDVLLPLGQQRVYAGNGYAWRQGDRAGVLTDIAAIETFFCKRVASVALAR